MITSALEPSAQVHEKQQVSSSCHNEYVPVSSLTPKNNRRRPHGMTFYFTVVHDSNSNRSALLGVYYFYQSL